MLAARHSLRSALFSCRLQPPLAICMKLRLPAPTLRAFTAIPRAAQRLDSQSDEEYVRTVREEWGDNLPEGLLTETELNVYQRYYGQPRRMLKEGENPLEEFEGVGAEKVDAPGSVTLQDKNGVGIEMYEEELEDSSAVEVNISDPREAKQYEQLQRDIERAHRRQEEQSKSMRTLEGLDEEFSEDDLLDMDIHDENAHLMRSHPLASLGRFATYPTTVQVPPSVQVPTMQSLSDVPNKHLDEAAFKLFGGPGLPHSPLFTNKGGKNLTENWLNVEDGRISDIGSEVFLATVIPGYYSQSLSALTELRRRLGGEWVLGREGEGGVTNILDIGSGGAGVLAWKTIMEAEHNRRQDEAREAAGEAVDEAANEAPEAVGEAAGEVKAENEAEGDSAEASEDITAGLRATVVTASNPLRHRMAKFLENTIFLPRIPDRNPDNLFHSPDQPDLSFSPNPKQPRKVFDLIIATNNFLPLKESHLRKDRLRKLWSHLNPKGGVLLLIEKGTPLGFEAIASARASLLRNNISSPGSESRPIGGNTGLAIDDEPISKEVGAIIAPCTNHSECPMFPKGSPHGASRRDWCRFTQRYERPTYMQRIIGESRANHEDLQFSYIAVRRGEDYRRSEKEIIEPELDEFKPPPSPGAPAESPYSMDQLRRFAFTLPRTILPPIKRHGHITLDVCTPAGKIERWVVPKSFGKVQFREARKSKWGDLWALGAKTKVSRNLKIGIIKSKGKSVETVSKDGRLEEKVVYSRTRLKHNQHWSRGNARLGEVVHRKREKRQQIRWASQREEMEMQREDTY